MTRTHSRIVPHGQCNSMPTGDAHQSTPAQLTGLALILSHSLRYTGYKTTHRQVIASTTTHLETEIIQISDLIISISIEPAPTHIFSSCWATHHPCHFFGFIRCMGATHFEKWVGAAFGSKATLRNWLQLLSLAGYHWLVDIWTKQTVIRNIDSSHRIWWWLWQPGTKRITCLFPWKYNVTRSAGSRRRKNCKLNHNDSHESSIRCHKKINNQCFVWMRALHTNW